MTNLGIFCGLATLAAASATVLVSVGSVLKAANTGARDLAG